jgi:hypothetical protein
MIHMNCLSGLWLLEAVAALGFRIWGGGAFEGQTHI